MKKIIFVIFTILNIVAGGSNVASQWVDTGLATIAAKQNADGSWGKENIVQNTALCLLGLAGSGNTTSQGIYKNQVRKAARFLKESQQKTGEFAKDISIVDQAIATLAICEIYALSNYHPLLRRCAQRGCDYLIVAMGKEGWSNDNKGAVANMVASSWAIMALKSAKIAHIQVPEEAFDRMKKLIDKLTDRNYYRVHYSKNLAAMPKESKKCETTTAMAMTSLIFCGANRGNKQLIGGAGLISQCFPEEKQAQPLYWYFATLAMYQMGGNFWQDWNTKLMNLFEKFPKQNWTSINNDKEIEYLAFNILSLEISSRYQKAP